MDVQLITEQLRAFINGHGVAFARLATRYSQLVEATAFCVAVNHYLAKGYTVQARQLDYGRFRLKTTSQGYPWNFSHWLVQRDGNEFEIHVNLAVAGAYGADGAVYVVDVAVVNAGHIPTSKPADGQWLRANNDELITLVEAKALVVYPMLIAQFIGIVHELLPQFLGVAPSLGFVAADHFKPSLVSLGYLKPGSERIVLALPDRDYFIGVAPNIDGRFRGGPVAPGDDSPLD